MKMMLDESYRADPLHHGMGPGGDLDSTWLGGESVSSSNKVKPPPLNTARLKVFRQATRVAVLSILETGDVSVEFMKKRGDQERTVELLVVSGDGQTIGVEQSRADGTSDTTNTHPADFEKTWKTFSYSAMPEKYWNKYSRACRFVDLVKSKTAKVTIYSNRAKGVLMENWPPNFEATFFQGTKIVMHSNEVHITEESGASMHVHHDSMHNLGHNYRDLIQHASRLREQCLRLEASVMTVQAMSHNNDALFPVIVGTRPSTSFCSSTSSNSGSMDFLSSPRFNHLHSSSASASSGSQGGHSASPPSSPPPEIDVRCLDTSVRQTPTSGPLASPLRHISTLEGRKMRRQLSDSAESSFLQHSTPLSAAQSSPALCSRASPTYSQESTEQGSSRVADNCCFVNAFPGGGMQGGQGASPEIPEEVAHQGQLFIASPVRTSSPQKTPLFSTPQRNPAPWEDMSHTGYPAQEQGRALSQNGGVPSGMQTTHSCLACCEARSTPESPLGVSSPMKPSFSAPPQSYSYSISSPMKGTPSFNTATPQQTSSLASSQMKGAGVEAGAGSNRDLLGEESCAVVRQTFVAYTGWVSQLANGTIWVRYNEGTQLGVNPGLPLIVYVDQQGCRQRFLQTDDLPEVVRQKLEKMKVVVDSLQRQPSAAQFTPAST